MHTENQWIKTADRQPRADEYPVWVNSEKLGTFLRTDARGFEKEWEYWQPANIPPPPPCEPTQDEQDIKAAHKHANGIWSNEENLAAATRGYLAGLRAERSAIAELVIHRVRSNTLVAEWLYPAADRTDNRVTLKLPPAIAQQLRARLGLEGGAK